MTRSGHGAKRMQPRRLATLLLCWVIGVGLSLSVACGGDFFGQRATLQTVSEPGEYEIDLPADWLISIHEPPGADPDGPWGIGEILLAANNGGLAGEDGVFFVLFLEQLDQPIEVFVRGQETEDRAFWVSFSGFELNTNDTHDRYAGTGLVSDLPQGAGTHRYAAVAIDHPKHRPDVAFVLLCVAEAQDETAPEACSGLFNRFRVIGG